MRGRIALSAGLLVALAAGGMLLGYNESRSLAAPARLASAIPSVDIADRAVPAASPSARVARVEGVVEGKSPEGTWKRLATGDVLHPDDVVRTDGRAVAQLELGDHILVDVAERTTITVGQVSATLSRVRLDDGRLGTSVGDGAAENVRVKVEVRGRDVTAEAGKGRFGVLKRADGPVAVVTERGSVDVSSEGATVKVNAGQQTLVERGKRPDKPTKVPGSLFMKLSRPKAVRSRVAVQGVTVPGAEISVEGEPLGASASGRFSHVIVLRKGANTLTVEVVDALGRRIKRRVPLAVDEPASKDDKLNARVDW